MALLQGKRGLIMGIANERSIAYAVALHCREQGADLIITHQGGVMEKRVVPLAESLHAADVITCDVTSEADFESLFARITSKHQGSIDFIVHSIAFADKDALQGRFSETPRDKYLQAIDVSAFSFVNLAKHASRLAKPPSSMLTMTYLGANKVMPGYNVMGVAKAALEASVRYLAHDLGPQGIRVNALSAGPLRTLASSAVRNLKAMLSEGAQTSPLKRPITTDDVAKASLYLLSDLSSGVTGEIHYVDAGFNIMGASSPSRENV